MNLSNEQKLLIYCCQAPHRGDKLDKIRELLYPPLNWDEVLESAKWHRIETLLYNSLIDLPESQSIPPDFIEYIKKCFYSNTIKNINLFKELEHLLDIFEKKGLNVMLLKGSFLGKTIYSNDAIRPLTDIDIMVKVEDLEKAEKTLSENGYIFNGKRSPVWYRENNYHYQYAHPVKNIMVELHWHILSKSEPDQIAIKEYDIINGFWERAIPLEIYDSNALTLCPNDLLFYQCIHFLKHRFQSPNGGYRGVFNSKGSLLQLNDIYGALKYYRDAIDWESLELEAAKYKVTHLIYSTLYLVRNIFGTDNDILNEITKISEPGKLDHDLINLIQNRLFVREYVFSINPVSFYESIREGNFKLKIKSLIHGLFPHPEMISKFYSLPISSKKIYFYYLRYIYDFINHNKGHISAKPTLNEARVINKWIAPN
ncbi:MAG: nucleotidyltransferase domain-containing protein [Thermodesulfobacteriota bacterium]